MTSKYNNACLQIKQLPFGLGSPIKTRLSKHVNKVNHSEVSSRYIYILAVYMESIDMFIYKSKTTQRAMIYINRATNAMSITLSIDENSVASQS